MVDVVLLLPEEEEKFESTMRGGNLPLAAAPDLVALLAFADKALLTLLVAQFVLERLIDC